MSLPTDSVAPAPPTGSSNPWSLVQWWKRICDWIAALSPSGATEYDTGWVDVTAASGFTSTGAAVRRVGKRIEYKGSLAGALTANVTTVIGNLPAGFAPPANDGRSTTAGAATGGVSVYYMAVTSAGAIQVRVGATGTHNVALGALGYLMD